MPAYFEIESAQRAQQLMKELVSTRGTDNRLRLMAQILAETGYIADTPHARYQWSGASEGGIAISKESWGQRPA